MLPDLWQQECVRALRAGKDVVVHAPTGAGKTYIFELLYPSLRGQAIFTVPTRALANDKLAEWRARGWDVGIATGDLAQNLDARVVVATLETQKGRFLKRLGPSLMVIDEYQMIGDPVRGVNYELALALAPASTQLLLLSGSVGNPESVVAWLRRIGRDALLVSHQQRPVPLEEIDLTALPDRVGSKVRGAWPRAVANALSADLGPILMFAPLRNAAEELARQLAGALPWDAPLSLTPEQMQVAGPQLTKLLRARVAYHHSGLSYAQRAGLIEPLAKNGQLRVVVATMGLAAGINFSMRSVIITGTSYKAGYFERQVQPDELLQMFGRAGRRGLDETGYALVSMATPRLLEARPRQLRRAQPLDWPSLLAVMRGAADRRPFAAALELCQRLFTPVSLPLGIEHSLETGPMPCALEIDLERARFLRHGTREQLNSRGEWESQPENPQPAPLGELLVREEERWVRAIGSARIMKEFGFGNLCRLPGKHRRYGREVVIGQRTGDGTLHLAPWLRRLCKLAKATVEDLEKRVLPDLGRSYREFSPKTDAEPRLESVYPEGNQLRARFSFDAIAVPAWRDQHGAFLLDPPVRRELPVPCRACPEASWCDSAPVVSNPAYEWRRLGLIEPNGVPTRRGILFSFFSHGEGLAIAAALEEADYHLDDLVFDIANLRAGERFSGEENRYGGRLAGLCQQRYGRGDLPGYLELGVPINYGAGASEVVREIVEHGTPRHKLLTEELRQGDLERALVEWRSLLRHIVLAPDYDWDRWRALKNKAAELVDATTSPSKIELPLLTGSQLRRR